MNNDLSLNLKLQIGDQENLDPQKRNQNKKKAIESRSKKIGRILTDLRLNIDMTQQETATAIGIAQTTYAGYETGRHEPSIEILIRLADIYKVSMDYITGRYEGSDDIDDEEYYDAKRIEDEEAEQEYRDMIDSENFSSLMTYRDTKKQIKEEQKKRGTYNRAKKNKKKDQPTR